MNTLFNSEQIRNCSITQFRPTRSVLSKYNIFIVIVLCIYYDNNVVRYSFGGGTDGLTVVRGEYIITETRARRVANKIPDKQRCCCCCCFSDAPAYSWAPPGVYIQPGAFIHCYIIMAFH